MTLCKVWTAKHRLSITILFTIILLQMFDTQVAGLAALETRLSRRNFLYARTKKGSKNIKKISANNVKLINPTQESKNQGPPLVPFDPPLRTAVDVLVENVREKEPLMQVRAISVQSREMRSWVTFEGENGNVRKKVHKSGKPIDDAAHADVVAVLMATPDNSTTNLWDNEERPWNEWSVSNQKELAMQFSPRDILSDPVLRENKLLDFSWANHYLQADPLGGKWERCQLAYYNSPSRFFKNTKGRRRRNLTGQLVFTFYMNRNDQRMRNWQDEIVVTLDREVLRKS